MTSDLPGLRILLTRSAEGNRAWSDLLTARGACPIALDCLEHEALPEAAEPLRAACARADTLALTSPRGVVAAQALLGARPPGLRIAVVGPATARAARAAFARVDLLAGEGTAAGLAERLLGLDPPPARVVLATAREGRPDLPEALRAAGVTCTVVPVYATRLPGPAATRRDLASERLDAIFLASPSAFAGLQRIAHVPPGVALVTLGPTTSAAVRAAGWTVFAESTGRDLEGLLAAYLHQRTLEVAP